MPTPAAPTGVIATAGDESATISWDAVTASPALARYTVITYSGATPSPQGSVDVAAPGTAVDITGLTNGSSYTFTVTATNASGTSPESAPSAAVVPSGPPTEELIPPPVVIPNCSLCKYFDPIPQTVGAPGPQQRQMVSIQSGYCRHNPPVVSTYPSGRGGGWPICHPGDWCGEFEYVKAGIT